MPISNISFPTGLEPKSKFFAEVGEDCINMDGVIALMRSIDTPQAKAIYKAFRRRYAKMRQNPGDKTDKKIREEAVLAALADVGHHVTFTDISGGKPA